LTIGGERCPSSRRLGARLPLFAHGYYEAPDACPPIPGDCPRDISSVDDDTCDEVEGPPPCRGLNAIPPFGGFCVDEGNTCYGKFTSECSIDTGFIDGPVYKVNGIAPAANGCCHPVA
jgi:hypothetical protein